MLQVVGNSVVVRNGGLIGIYLIQAVSGRPVHLVAHNAISWNGCLIQSFVLSM